MAMLLRYRKIDLDENSSFRKKCVNKNYSQQQIACFRAEFCERSAIQFGVWIYQKNASRACFKLIII